MASCHTFHHHVCPKCWHIWGHSPDEIETKAESKAAHTCPKCGDGKHWWAMDEGEAKLCVQKQDALPPEIVKPSSLALARALGLLDG